MRRKITIVGAGNVGASTAHACLMAKLGDVVLIDVVENTAKGKALDLAQASSLEGHGCMVKGTGNYDDTADSDLVVVTAGIARKPGMSRDDLLKTNISIVTQVMKETVARSPNALFIIVSNPVDVMCMVALKASGLPARRVIGLSGVLDGARMRAYIAEAVGVPPQRVHGLTIGEHGDTMVPLPRLSTIGGVPVPKLLPPDVLDEIQKKTTAGGAGVVALLGYSAFYAPGAAITSMAEALLTNSKMVLACSVYLEGQYGARDMYMGAPARLGKDGVESVIELDLNAEEKAALDKSIASIQSNLEGALKLM